MYNSVSKYRDHAVTGENVVCTLSIRMGSSASSAHSHVPLFVWKIFPFDKILRDHRRGVRVTWKRLSNLLYPGVGDNCIAFVCLILHNYVRKKML